MAKYKTAESSFAGNEMGKRVSMVGKVGVFLILAYMLYKISK